MPQTMEYQIKELINTQIDSFSQQGKLSQAELTECLERFNHLRQLCRDLDATKPSGPVPPWSTRG